MATPYIRSEAIILRRTNYGEADRIINFLTLHHGKVSAIAKGVRKPKSKLAGGLELLAVSDITITRGRGEMGVVTSAQLIKFFGDILKDYDRLQLANTMMKTINQVSETVAEPDFYHLLKNGLEYLNHHSIDERVTELWFRLQISSLLGHPVNLATSSDSKALSADENYDFDFASNSFTAAKSGRFGGDHIKFLRLVQAKNPALVRQVGGVEAVLADCLWLARNL